jgi:hypothetical protein
MFVTLFTIGNNGCEVKYLDFKCKEVVVVYEKHQFVYTSYNVILTILE